MAGGYKGSSRGVEFDRKRVIHLVKEFTPEHAHGGHDRVLHGDGCGEPTIFEGLMQHLKNTVHSGETISLTIRQEAQDCAVQSIVEEEDKDKIVSTLNAVSIFRKVTPEEMRSSRKI